MKYHSLYTAITLAIIVTRSVGFLAPSSIRSTSHTHTHAHTETAKPVDDSVSSYSNVCEDITEENPLRVIIAGGGIGGLALAQSLCKNPMISVTILERNEKLETFGSIQLASNALQVIKEMDPGIYNKILSNFTCIGDKENGIIDGVRDEWYANFDLSTPALQRNLSLSGVISRNVLQQIYLDAIPEGIINYGDGVVSYDDDVYGLNVIMDSGRSVQGDVLIGGDGIRSYVRAAMRDEPIQGDGSGSCISYSGYTVFSGELKYHSFDKGLVGYKVYIGPGAQYFVITDVGNERYQWCAYLARQPDTSSHEEMLHGSSIFLQNTFDGWSKDIRHILNATNEDEIEQIDLYDMQPSVLKPWFRGHVALLGDAVHAMMPNLGQGGCQAIEDAYVVAQELNTTRSREDIGMKLKSYNKRRLIRSAVVQGLSRFASDIIIRGFNTPAKNTKTEENGMKFENLNYSGIVTKLLQPILPVFISIQFKFLFSGWRNDSTVDLNAAIRLLTVGGVILLICFGIVEESALFAGVGIEGLLGIEGLGDAKLGSMFTGTNDVFDATDVIDIIQDKTDVNVYDIVKDKMESYARIELQR